MHLSPYILFNFYYDKLYTSHTCKRLPHIPDKILSWKTTHKTRHTSISMRLSILFTLAITAMTAAAAPAPAAADLDKRYKNLVSLIWCFIN